MKEDRAGNAIYRRVIILYFLSSTQMLCDYCAVRTESLTVIRVDLSLRGLKQNERGGKKICGI
jgi:hypothetical protein